MFFALILAFSFANHFSDVTAEYLLPSNGTDGDKIVYEKYVTLDKNVRKLVFNGIRRALPYLMEANEHLNITSSCKKDLFQLFSGIRQLKTSHLRFLDATGKIPAGLMTGTMHMLGDYDECMSSLVLRNDRNVAFKGQYCLVSVRPVLPRKKGIITIHGGLEGLVEYTRNTTEAIQFLVSIMQTFYDNPNKLGLCIPSGCISEDASSMLNFIGKSYINATVEYCDQQGESQFETGTMISIIAFSLLGLLAVIGSLMDYYSRKTKFTFQGKTGKFLLCFSVPANFPKVISSNISDKSLSSIYGIRSLSIFYIILLHLYLFGGTMQMQGHMLSIKEEFSQFFMQIVLNGFLTTEVFFFIGGLLNIYTRMKLHKNGKSNLSVIQIIFHRLWRLYPAYIFSILTAFLLLNGQGPMGTRVRQEYLGNCQKNWWQNILFINNYFIHRENCLPHSWYIAADTQLFLISLFTVPVLLRDSKRGIILHLGVLATGIVGTALWAWYKGIMPSLIVYRLSLSDIFKVQNAYASTIPHIAPYFTGLIVGYILSKWNQFKIPAIYQFIGWLLAAVSFMSMLFVTTGWNSGKPFTIAESSLYFAFSKLLYVLSVAWLVVCCAKGYGGVLNYILSIKIWVPISRISYMIYLISYLVQAYNFQSTKMLIDTDKKSIIWRYMGDLSISCLMALAMVVIIESPFISMEKLLFRRSAVENENCVTNAEEQRMDNDKENHSKELEMKKNIQNTIVSFELQQ